MALLRWMKHTLVERIITVTLIKKRRVDKAAAVVEAQKVADDVRQERRKAVRLLQGWLEKADVLKTRKNAPVSPTADKEVASHDESHDDVEKDKNKRRKKKKHSKT